VVATQEHPVMVLIGSSVTSDSNVFHLPPPPNPQAVVGGLPSPIASAPRMRAARRQAVRAATLSPCLTETVYRYDNFSFLDFNALRYQGTWQWHFTPRVSGTLAADRSEALVN